MDTPKTNYKPTTCEINIQGYETEAIVDSGAAVTVITKGLMDKTSYEITGSSRTKLNPFGEGKYPSIGIIKNMEFFIGNTKSKIDVEVVDFPEEMLLLGTDWIIKEKAAIDLDTGFMTLRKIGGKREFIPVTYKEKQQEIENEDEEYEEEYEDERNSY